LAAVEKGEGRRLPRPVGWKFSHVLAAGTLDFQHLGAGFGKQKGRQRPRQQRGEVSDQNAVERFHARFLSMKQARREQLMPREIRQRRPRDESRETARRNAPPRLNPSRSKTEFSYEASP